MMYDTTPLLPKHIQYAFLKHLIVVSIFVYYLLNILPNLAVHSLSSNLPLFSILKPHLVYWLLPLVWPLIQYVVIPFFRFSTFLCNTVFSKLIFLVEKINWWWVFIIFPKFFRFSIFWFCYSTYLSKPHIYLFSLHASSSTQLGIFPLLLVFWFVGQLTYVILLLGFAVSTESTLKIFTHYYSKSFRSYKFKKIQYSKLSVLHKSKVLNRKQTLDLDVKRKNLLDLDGYL